MNISQLASPLTIATIGLAVAAPNAVAGQPADSLAGSSAVAGRSHTPEWSARPGLRDGFRDSLRSHVQGLSRKVTRSLLVRPARLSSDVTTRGSRRDHSPLLVKRGVATYSLSHIDPGSIRAAWLKDTSRAIARLKARKVRAAAGRGVLSVRLRGLRWESVGRNAADRRHSSRRGRSLARASISGGSSPTLVVSYNNSSAKPQPRSKRLPVISGTAQAGRTLTAGTGTWFNAPTSFGYQWLRCNSAGSSCAAVSAATAKTYALGAGDVGSTMRVRVTASNYYGAGTATSAQTAVVSGAPAPAPTPTPTPSPTPTPTPSPTPTPTPSPTPVVPGPIAGQGYQQVFRDEFDTLNRSVWDDHIWYQPPAQPGAQSVENSVLHLRSFKSQGFQPTTVTTKSSGRTWTRGYFEARMRWTQGGAGTWPSFWLFSYRHATNPAWPSVNPYCANNGLPKAECLIAELDIMDEGDVPTTHVAGLHRNTGGHYGEWTELRPSPNWFPQPVNLSVDWHTYAAEWTATQVKFYLDNALVATLPVFDTTNQPLFMLLQNWTGSGCWKCGTPTADTDVQVDWVRVWQK